MSGVVHARCKRQQSCTSHPALTGVTCFNTTPSTQYSLLCMAASLLFFALIRSYLLFFRFLDSSHPFTNQPVGGPCRCTLGILTLCTNGVVWSGVSWNDLRWRFQATSTCPSCHPLQSACTLVSQQHHRQVDPIHPAIHPSRRLSAQHPPNPRRLQMPNAQGPNWHYVALRVPGKSALECFNQYNRSPPKKPPARKDLPRCVLLQLEEIDKQRELELH